MGGPVRFTLSLTSSTTQTVPLIRFISAVIKWMDRVGRGLHESISQKGYCCCWCWCCLRHNDLVSLALQIDVNHLTAATTSAVFLVQDWFPFETGRVSWGARLRPKENCTRTHSKTHHMTLYPIKINSKTGLSLGVQQLQHLDLTSHVRSTYILNYGPDKIFERTRQRKSESRPIKSSSRHVAHSLDERETPTDCNKQRTDVRFLITHEWGDRCQNKNSPRCLLPRY